MMENLPPVGGRPERILCLAFLLSGAAALLLETLWFRLLGLVLGNSVWASTMVLTAFMAGIGLGNALAVRLARRLDRPLRAYAVLELSIAVMAVALAVLLPRLTGLLTPALRPFLAHPWLLNTVRAAVSLLLLFIPCTAMGAGLPLAVRALSAGGSPFGRSLGLLYGWNTLGAVAGAVGGEVLLIPRLGLRGTSMAAAALDVTAATIALVLARRSWAGRQPETEGDRAAPTRSGRLLAAAALAGALLLALEVVWFRFLQLFVQGTSLALAVMLAVVLAGISAGGLLGGFWAGRQEVASRHAPAVAAAAALATLVGYLGFPYAGWFVLDPWPTAVLAVRLMGPTCVLSGLLFTLMGTALQRRAIGESRTTGLLTLANTMGGAAGALLAGLLLLRSLGMERSFLLAALGYVGVTVLLLTASPDLRPAPGRGRLVAGVLLAASLAGLALFPHGLMRNHFVPRMARRYQNDGSRLVALREGLTETIAYLEQDLWDQPYAYRLVTNGYSMSASGPLARRYMKLFVYWPVALRPNPRRALLVSYGVGSTARALTDTRSLTDIDVVDISRDVLDMGRIVFRAGGFPLDDPRVRVHVEDGRFFLQTTRTEYDLITSEPPPPKNAGISSLFSEEYFRLVHGRLAPGGVATHWLPVEQLTPDDARAVIRAFCDVFEDCSLWNGSGFDWMLAGSRGGTGAAGEEDFTAQWRDPIVARELQAVGLEVPEQLGALFLGDASDLARLVGGRPPLVDDRPGRLSHALPDTADPFYATVADVDAARGRFLKSEFVRRRWPPALRDRTAAFFEDQRYFNGQPAGWPQLARVLRETPLLSLPLQMLGSSPDEQRLAGRALAAGRTDGDLRFRSGLGALAARDYARAETLFGAASPEPSPPRWLSYRLAAACLGRGESASAGTAPGEAAPRADDPFWKWLDETCPPRGPG